MASSPSAGRDLIDCPARKRKSDLSRLLIKKTAPYSPLEIKFALICLACWIPHLLACQVSPPRRVLILNEVGRTYPLIDLIDQGVRSSLSNSPNRVEFYREYLDTVLFPDPADQRMQWDFYIRKYQNRKPEVIITVGPTPLKFMLESHSKFFAGIPVVYCVPNRLPGHSVADPEFTGIESDIAPGLTLTAALHLLPHTKHVVVVGGTAPYDRGQQAEVKEQLKGYEDRLEISYLTDLSVPSLLERLKALPRHTIVLLTPVGKDADGRTFNSSEIGPMVISAANAPVFSLTDRYLGHGEVGGDISSGIEQGKLAGRMAARLLNGEKPTDIPRADTATAYVFDSQALKRWDLKERDLPPGSMVVNRQPTAWESYRWYIIGGISLMCIEGLLIGGLLWQHARRRDMNRALQKQTTELQAREELLKIFVKDVPAGVAMLDRDMRYLQVSDRWCADYGVDCSRILGRSHYEVFPDMPEHWRQAHRRALAGETLRADEERWDRKSGTTWVRWEVLPWRNQVGEPGGILIFAEEITRRKQVEQELSGMSRKLIQTQEQERSRIGRELHDDINQRLALLAVELEQLEQSGSTKDLRYKLQESKARVMDIAAGVEALSHQLHSSKLEYLGLAAAAKSLCRELSEAHHVRIDFTQNSVPRNLPEEVALCLFRVLQEALQNAVKYSGGSRFEVDLCGTAANMRLIVRDFGRGFDPDEAMKTKGLGLVSMRERVNLVNGTIEIQSKETVGTEITVSVPLIKMDHAREVVLGAA
jgi:PAS domain S-box-containing protein